MFAFGCLSGGIPKAIAKSTLPTARLIWLHRFAQIWAAIVSELPLASQLARERQSGDHRRQRQALSAAIGQWAGMKRNLVKHFLSTKTTTPNQTKHAFLISNEGASQRSGSSLRTCSLDPRPTVCYTPFINANRVTIADDSPTYGLLKLISYNDTMIELLSDKRSIVSALTASQVVIIFQNPDQSG